MKKKILLVGGAGFIGHNLSILLKKNNFDVSIVDNLEVNNIRSIKSIKNHYKRKLYNGFLNERFRLLKKYKIKLHKINANNIDKLRAITNKFNPDFVVHLAAVSHDGKSNLNPKYAFNNSYKTLFNTLEILKSKNKTHLIFLSSSMVYGTFQKKIVDEIENCNPIGIYGSLKLSAELLIKAYHNVFSQTYTIIRPSALYGERCISNRVIQIFLENAFEKKEIVINGDGKEKLDFTYIDDFCKGILKIIQNPKKSQNQTFNITYGSSQSILKLKKLITAKFKDQKFSHKKRNKLMAIRGTLSIKKARKLLKYKPKFGIVEGFEKYYLWYRKLYGTK